MHKALWQYILSDVSSKVSKNVLDTWFRPLVVKDQNDHLRLVVCAPNIVVCDFVEQHYKRLIYSLTKKHVPKINAVEFVVAEDEDPKRTFLFENKRAMDMPSQPGPFILLFLTAILLLTLLWLVRETSLQRARHLRWPERPEKQNSTHS